MSTSISGIISCRYGHEMKTANSTYQTPMIVSAPDTKRNSGRLRQWHFWSGNYSSVWCLMFGIWATAHSAESPRALQNFLAAQTNLLTWSSDLTQIRQLKTLTQPLTATGRVWFAAPNRFRWEIGDPAQTIAVRTDKQMLVIYPRLKRVEKYPLSGERMGQWKNTLALLEAGFPRSQRDVEQLFKIVSITASNEVDNVLLRPRSGATRRLMPQITISFTTNDFQLRATELQFGDGSTMRNEFRNSKLNPKLEDSLFAPTLEADFKVVEPMKR